MRLAHQKSRKYCCPRTVRVEGRRRTGQYRPRTTAILGRVFIPPKSLMGHRAGAGTESTVFDRPLWPRVFVQTDNQPFRLSAVRCICGEILRVCSMTDVEGEEPTVEGRSAAGCSPSKATGGAERSVRSGIDRSDAFLSEWALLQQTRSCGWARIALRRNLRQGRRGENSPRNVTA